MRFSIRFIIFFLKICENNYVENEHHLLCSQSEELLRLASLPRQQTKKTRFSFKRGYQPKYIYKATFIQTPWVIPLELAEYAKTYVHFIRYLNIQAYSTLVKSVDCVALLSVNAS